MSGATKPRASLLSVRGLSKTFPGLLALDNVTFSVASGEVVAVVGQNGSGKSTLVKTLAGVHAPDAGGSVEVRAANGALLSGSAAPAELHFLHQDLGLVPGLSTIENLDLAVDHGRDWFRPFRSRVERHQATDLIARFGGHFDVTLPVSQLTSAERTVVAIARALAGWDRPDQVLVLDEPTATLHGGEVAQLFAAVRRVAEEGAGVIFISHRLDEVMKLADRVIALRGGRLVADVTAGKFDHDDLVAMITGRELAGATTRRPNVSGATGLSVSGMRGSSVNGADLDVRAGEIVGVSGLIGSGREHLCGLIFGAIARLQGQVRIDEELLSPATPRAAIKAGVAYVPADRHAEGAVLSMSATENLTLPQMRSLTRLLGWLSSGAERQEAAKWSERVGLSPPTPERPLEQFSGGNQQKVVLARCLRLQPKVLLLDEPTQGVDIGAKAAIYNLIQEAASSGAAVVLASSDEKELCELCDRVVVMRDGQVTASVSGGELTETQLVLHNLGLATREAAAVFAGDTSGVTHG